MRLFRCGNCNNPVYFENNRCTHCGSDLGYLPTENIMVAFRYAGETQVEPPGLGPVRMCANYHQHQICNWLLPVDSTDPYCLSCRLNRTIPDLSQPGNLQRWHTLETEKRQLIYSLLRLGLPFHPFSEGAGGLGFDFLADQPPHQRPEHPVMTGHDQGLITINIAEADAVAREAKRNQMAESYRTVLGHFRHESGHYFWDQLVWNTPWLPSFRDLFGDERMPYQAALSTYYNQGPPAGWHHLYVSQYASSHPWEDWAETWAHYLHMIDTLETAYQFGMRFLAPTRSGEPQEPLMTFAPYQQTSFAILIDYWLPLTVALNSLNRSMGHPHAYPFTLSPKAIEKLAFVHELVSNYRHANNNDMT